MSGFAGDIDSWLATARQEKIANLKGVNGYNPPRYTRETCNGGGELLLLLLLKFSELSVRTVPEYQEKSLLQSDDPTVSPSVPHAQASTCDIPAGETEATHLIRGWGGRR